MTSLGKYQLEELIGRGTYAEVYRAVDTVLHRTVALKLLKGAFLSDEEAVARFLQEARTGANLIHPQIAWVWDLGELDGRYFLSMRYIEGQTLDRLLQNQGPLRPGEALNYLYQISDALIFAHSSGLVHRDIKPQNIMISQKDGAVLTDFGLVRAMEAGSIGTRTGSLMGTPAYIAPEIWRGQPASPAADQYSLGCVVVEMLTGVRLFGGPTPPAVMQQHLLEGPQLPGDWPDALIAVMQQVLAQDPSGRFADMAAFKAALQTLKFDGEPLSEDEHIPGDASHPAAVHPVPTASRLAPGPHSWTLEDGLAALKEMEADHEWQLAVDLLSDLESNYPHHPRLILPRKRITQVLAAQQEIEELARSKAEEKARRETEEKTRREAEEKAQRETEERARNEAEEKAQRESDEKAQLEVEEKARRETAARAKREAEEKFKREAEEKAQREAVLRPGFLRRVDDRIFIRLDKDQEMEFVRIPAGEFEMGSDPQKDKEAYSDEQPQHHVTLREYWIGRTPVTNAQYASFVQAVSGHAPNDWLNGQPPVKKLYHPVVKVTWQDAVNYCKWLSTLVGKSIYIPTEAEWEKAARGTDGRMYPWGDQLPDASICNYGLKNKDTSSVGQYSPLGDSPYGCMDMAGNVWEWCADWYDSYHYANASKINPTGPAIGHYRVVRGGSWLDVSRFIRSAYRFRHVPIDQQNNLGFRCLLDIT